MDLLDSLNPIYQLLKSAQYYISVVSQLPKFLGIIDFRLKEFSSS